LSEQYSDNNNLVVVDVNKDFMEHIKSIGSIDGFPTIKYIGNKGQIIEDYDNKRTLNEFINWIESKITNVVSKSSASNVYNRILKQTKKKQMGGRKSNKFRNKRKWTRKYKLSINCKRPKGFSQKQYCKYGRKIKNKR
jgi:predicted ATPase